MQFLCVHNIDFCIITQTSLKIYKIQLVSKELFRFQILNMGAVIYQLQHRHHKLSGGIREVKYCYGCKIRPEHLNHIWKGQIENMCQYRIGGTAVAE